MKRNLELKETKYFTVSNECVKHVFLEGDIIFIIHAKGNLPFIPPGHTVYLTLLLPIYIFLKSLAQRQSQTFLAM